MPIEDTSAPAPRRPGIARWIALLLLLALAGAVAWALVRRWRRAHEPLFTFACGDPASLEFSSPERLALVSGNTVELRSPVTGECVRRVELEGLQPDWMAAIWCGHAASSDKVKLRVWPLETGKLLRTFDAQTSLALARTSDRFATAAVSSDSRSLTIEVREVRTGSLLQTLPSPARPDMFVPALEFSPDGRELLLEIRWILRGRLHTEARVWSIPGGRPLGSFETFYVCGFTSSGEIVAAAEENAPDNLVVYAPDGTLRRRFTLPKPLRSVQDDIAVGRGHDALELLDLSTGERRRIPIHGTLRTGAFSRAANRVALICEERPTTVEVHELFP